MKKRIFSLILAGVLFASVSCGGGSSAGDDSAATSGSEQSGRLAELGAKDFGGKDESPSFVKGVLGRIARMIEAGETVADPAAMAVAEGESAADALEAALAGYDAFDETVEGGEISSEEAGE